MISYDLAKKLKDAGYPQSEKSGAIYHWKYSRKGKSDEAYVPTLSELIEACGSSFGLLKLEGGTFTAYPSPQKLRERKEWYLCMGSSEEAVANLWLALNKK